MLLIGCDPKSDTTSLLFGGKRLPDHHRDLARRRSWPARRSRSATSASSATACSRWSSAGPRSAAAAAGAASSTASRLLEKLGFHDWGFDYVLLDFLGDVVCGGFGLPIARDMCQKVIVVGIERPAVALRRQQRLLGGRILPQARRQCRRRRHGHQQGRRHRRGRRPSPRRSASRCWPRSRPTTTSAARAPTTRSSARPAASGRRCSRSWPSNVADAPPVRPKPLDAGRAARPVQRRRRPARDVVLEPATQADMRGKHLRDQAVARSGLRRGLTRDDMTATMRHRPHRARDRRRRRRRGLPCRRRDDAARPRRRRARARCSTQLRRGLSAQGGPHDQPQSMCPAFGSLRVGLRMRRTATILSGSACCVYGLTFTSHFYGARRTRRLRAVQLARRWSPASCSRTSAKRCTSWPTRRCTTPSSSPTCACRPPRGVPLQLLPKEINGVRIIGIDVPGFGVPTHAEAKDVLAGAMLKLRAQRGRAPARCRRRAAGAPSKPTVTLLGEMFPADPVGIGMHAGAAGPGRRPGGADARMARAVCRARLRRGRRDPSVLHRQRPRVRGRRPAGRRLGAGRRTTAPRPGSRPSARPAASPQDKIDAAKNARPAGDPRRARRQRRSRAASRVSGYEGSELLVARLLIESGADVPYVGTACPRTPWTDPDREWLEARACTSSTAPSSSRTSPRCASSSPTSRSAPRRWCSTPRSAAIPALYFTNLISARPLMGPAGAGALAQVVNAAHRQQGAASTG